MSRQIQGVNRELGRGISNALSANLLKGKIGEVKIIIGKKGNLAFVFGLGKVGNLIPETLRKAAAGVSKLCISNSVSSISFLIPLMAFAGFSPLGQALVQFIIVRHRYNLKASFI